AEEQDVAFLASDVDADGGKLILTGGAPKVTGNDEERILLALRNIVSSDLPLPVRIGTHRGAVFAGDIGPPYRRTYTVMGDAVNGKTRLLEALRDAVAGFRKQHAICEAYTSSIPYAVWRELLREMLEFGRDTDDDAIVERVRDLVAAKAPDLEPWLPLLAA